MTTVQVINILELYSSMTKKYVDVICLNDKDGNMKPLFLIWEDFKKIPIIKIKEICPRASIKAGNSGLRYTCILQKDKVRHLNYDRGKWFVETN